MIGEEGRREGGINEGVREFEMREQGGYDPYIFTTYVTNLKLIHFLHFKAQNVQIFQDKKPRNYTLFTPLLFLE